jgi:hypothetical protein
MAETRASPIPDPPLAVFEVYRLRVIGAQGGNMTVNTLYYESSQEIGSGGENTQIELISLFIAVDSCLQAYVSATSIDWKGVKLTVDLPTSPALATFEHQLTNLTGIGPTPALPNQMGVTIRKWTNWRGRRGRGRITVPSVPAAWCDRAILVEQSAFVNLCTELATTLQGAAQTYRPCLFSRDKEKNEVPITPMRTLVISKFTTNTILGTARRRKPGVGK